jgi:hypothetical protein
MISSDGLHPVPLKQSGTDHVLILPADRTLQLFAGHSGQESATSGRSSMFVHTPMISLCPTVKFYIFS